MGTISPFCFLSVCFCLYGLRSEAPTLLSWLRINYIKSVCSCQGFLWNTYFGTIEHNEIICKIVQEGPPLRGDPSAWRKNLFAMLRHFSELQKALKNGDHHRAGHPSGFPAHTLPPRWRKVPTFWQAQWPPLRGDPSLLPRSSPVFRLFGYGRMWKMIKNLQRNKNS